MVDKNQAKLCSSCMGIMNTYTDLKGWMTIRQKKFLERLRQEQDPAKTQIDLTEEPAAPSSQNAAMKTRDDIPGRSVYKKSSRVTKLDKLLDQNESIPRTQRESKFCTICNKTFSYRFTATSHIKMVHLKIKVKFLPLLWSWWLFNTVFASGLHLWHLFLRNFVQVQHNSPL